MKVRELIDVLEEADPDAEVLLMTQSAWPFECAIAGIVVREEMLLSDPEREREEDAEPEISGEVVEEDERHSEEDAEVLRYAKGTAASDVFIVEGAQLRYGSKAAWTAVRSEGSR